MALGRHLDAAKTIQAGLERYTTSVRVLSLGVDVARMNNQPLLVRQYQNEIDSLWSRSAWRYKSAQNQIVLAKRMLDKNLDAKDVLQKFLTPVKENNPNLPEIHLAIGDLALRKHDTPFAAEAYTQAAKLDPTNPDAQFGLAMAFRDSNSALATKALAEALRLNPNYIPGLLLQADQLFNQERYDEADEGLQAILEINPHQPEAWAYRSAIANLTNQPKQEGEYYNRALALWQDNPRVDHLIGKKLSQKYRFSESIRHQRRALIYDQNYLPAKMQLAHDLLRIGNELEGWKVADEVFDADPYSVVAFNLVTLRDHLADFETIESDGFVIRMSKSEAAIYGQHVVKLLREAKSKLTQKYEVELQTPIFIEIFPKQSDFAIRTFGLPGGAGFLGVCFGRVVTMNSPAAQGPRLTNWESVLWHEFCHVVTLQKTKNRMPRWLSEGISVYEEKVQNKAWGQSMKPSYRTMLINDAFTPISQLSGAFLNPASPVHLELAYFQSSLAVEFIIETHGADILQRILEELAIGLPVNTALQRHLGPLKAIDQEFKSFVMNQCDLLAKNVDLSEPETTELQTPRQWKQALQDNPNNRLLLLGLAAAESRDEQYLDSNKTLEKLLQIYPMTSGAEPALQVMVNNYRKLDQPEKELEALETLISISASDVSACQRILELTTQKSDWEKTREYALKLIGVNPLIKSPHRYLAMAAENLKDNSATIQSLSSLVQMGPLDPADSHFRLASALFQEKQFQQAKRNVLVALEIAPRYQDAHKLLLKIIKSESVEANRDDTTPSEKGQR